MERRKNPRVAVNLTAALVNDRTLPIGCRVSDVSSTGMKLRHEGIADTSPIQLTDKVEVRVSLKKNNERKVIRLPLKITREAGNQFCGEFPKALPRLMELVEPYRIAEDAANETLPPASLDRHLLRSPPRPDITTDLKLPPPPKRPVLSSNWVLAALLVLSLTATLFVVLQNNQLSQRLAALESVQISDIERPLASSSGESLTERRLFHLDSRLNALVTATASLGNRITSLESIVPVELSNNNGGNATIAADAGWTVNLLSMNNERDALAFIETARAAGIPAELIPDTASKGEAWQVQVSGFTTREQAQSYSIFAREELGLKDVFIFSAPVQ